MADQPGLLLWNIPGGGVALALEYPPGEVPGAVLLSEEMKGHLIIELIGANPIKAWRRLPGSYVRQVVAGPQAPEVLP